ncbi:phosphatase PAP2 family protein [Sphaerochaeta globosa]|uniref:Phosphoesterase PA-phosphatase related protein n=1 Tax=Sphaerochaeta globosa (strain ATCC BAA-1886 / DSM 22777 / Buddy) TaxID=158189 RepID=F0RU13_SPHGB|nr:phosphatase PAP2 family protein [Sphaerochaeta globosa]ADY13872.1 phosphoesterase PA-phosphatase related protein [Sphaerochaeta globosa str. Buddy]
MKKYSAFLVLLIAISWSASAVNSFDRSAMYPYSKSFDSVGTAFEIASLLAPAILLGEQKSEYLTIGTIYAETMLAAYGLKELGKLCFQRARPFMYFTDYPQTKVDEGDAYDSFPSGHVTMAFAGASFACSVFAAYHPDSTWRLPVAVATYGFATATALLRVASGNHFMSDVLAGALIGTAVGLGIPFWHRKAGLTSFEATVSPYALAFRITL